MFYGSAIKTLESEQKMYKTKFFEFLNSYEDVKTLNEAYF